MNYRYFISPGPRFRLEAKFLAHIKIPSHLFLGENGFHYSLCFTIWKTKKKEWGGKKNIKKKKGREMMQSEVPVFPPTQSAECAACPSASVPRVSHTSCCTLLSPGPAPGSGCSICHTPPEQNQGEKGFARRAVQAWIVCFVSKALVCEV